MMTTCLKLPHPTQSITTFISAATNIQTLHDNQMLHVQFCSIHPRHDSWLRCWSGLSRVSRPGPGMSSNKSLVEVRWAILHDSLMPRDINLSGPDTWRWSLLQCTLRWQQNCTIATALFIYFFQSMSSWLLLTKVRMYKTLFVMTFQFGLWCW